MLFLSLNFFLGHKQKEINRSQTFIGRSDPKKKMITIWNIHLGQRVKFERKPIKQTQTNLLRSVKRKFYQSTRVRCILDVSILVGEDFSPLKFEKKKTIVNESI